MAMDMVTSGHIAHAQSMLDEDIFMAWGNFGSGYPDQWVQGQTPPPNNSRVTNKTRTRGSGDTDSMGDADIIYVVSLVDANGIVYVQGTDFYLDQSSINWSTAAKKPPAGRTYTVVYRKYDENITSLINELGRRRASEKAFVVEDSVAGDIDANGKKWRKVNYPTPNLYLSFKFGNDEAINSGSICQIALYVNSVPNPSLPSGQMYFTPSQIQSQGQMYMIENLEPFPRNTGKRELFEVVNTY